MSCARRSRRWRPCSAERKVCTQIRWTKLSAFRPKTAARIALRTQQVIAHESGVADTVDPLAGSYAIEELTTQLEEKARRLYRKDRRDGRNARGYRERLCPA